MNEWGNEIYSVAKVVLVLVLVMCIRMSWTCQYGPVHRRGIAARETPQGNMAAKVPTFRCSEQHYVVTGNQKYCTYQTALEINMYMCVISLAATVHMAVGCMPGCRSASVEAVAKSRDEDGSSSMTHLHQSTCIR
jgi:hypothetical protein